MNRTLNLLDPPAFGPRPPIVQPFEMGKQFADQILTLTLKVLRLIGYNHQYYEAP